MQLSGNNYTTKTWEPNIIDKLGYKPFVGTVVGFGRITCGAAEAALGGLAGIVSMAITGSPQHFGTNIDHGLSQIARGVIEAAPFIGGDIARHEDEKRIQNISRQRFK